MLLAYDLLEDGGVDLRDRALCRAAGAAGGGGGGVAGGDAAAPVARDCRLRAGMVWRQSGRRRARCRPKGVMLKRAASPYHVGRKRGDWWKWKLDPWTVDAVMIYAQAGHGRRANLYTDFTFAVRDGNTLVPFTKAYSGLTDAEFNEITRWVQKNTLERFGPVRRVPPELVFEIGFEGIQESPRHKSGIALRFPRMLRWRRDKPVDEIDTLDGLREMLRVSRG